MKVCSQFRNSGVSSMGILFFVFSGMAFSSPLMYLMAPKKELSEGFGWFILFVWVFFVLLGYGVRSFVLTLKWCYEDLF